MIDPSDHKAVLKHILETGGCRSKKTNELLIQAVDLFENTSEQHYRYEYGGRRHRSLMDAVDYFIEKSTKATGDVNINHFKATLTAFGLTWTVQLPSSVQKFPVSGLKKLLNNTNVVFTTTHGGLVVRVNPQTNKISELCADSSTELPVSYFKKAIRSHRAAAKLSSLKLLRAADWRNRGYLVQYLLDQGRPLSGFRTDGETYELLRNNILSVTFKSKASFQLVGGFSLDSDTCAHASTKTELLSPVDALKKVRDHYGKDDHILVSTDHCVLYVNDQWYQRSSLYFEARYTHGHESYNFAVSRPNAVTLEVYLKGWTKPQTIFKSFDDAIDFVDPTTACGKRTRAVIDSYKNSVSKLSKPYYGVDSEHMHWVFENATGDWSSNHSIQGTILMPRIVYLCEDDYTLLKVTTEGEV